MSFWHGRAVSQETNGPVEIGIEANAWASACKHDTSPHLGGTTLESAPATRLRLLRLGSAAVSITDCSSAHNCSKVAVATAPEVAARNARQPDKRHLIMSDRKSATETPNGHATPSSGHPCNVASSTVPTQLHVAVSTHPVGSCWQAATVAESHLMWVSSARQGFSGP